MGGESKLLADGDIPHIAQMRSADFSLSVPALAAGRPSASAALDGQQHQSRLVADFS